MAGGNLYTKEELNIVMDPNVTAKEAAKRTGRSVESIRAKRHNMGYRSARIYINRKTDTLPPISNLEPIPTWPYNMLIKADIIDGTEPLSDKQFEGLNKAMECLSAREQAVIRLYFVEGVPLEDCGKEFNVTRERIRQVIAKALRKLRHPTRANMIRYGEDIREKNQYLERLKSIKEEIAAYEAYIEEHKDSYTALTAYEVPDIMNDLSIDELDLSVRSYNSLKRKGIKWASEVVALVNSGEIVKVRNLGRKSYLEIAERLKEKGFNVEVTV